MKQEFANRYKVDSKDTDKVLEKKTFLEMLNGNDKVLNMLSLERLEQLEKYYSDIIKQNDEKIKKLKSKK